MSQKLTSVLMGLVILMSSLGATAELNSSLDLGLRNRPQGNNLVGTVAYEGLLWGEGKKENPLYGFYGVGLRGGGSPTAAAFVQISPIAPLVFEVQQGRTYRFFNSNVLNCETYECQGRIDRTDYSVKGAAAYQNFIFLGSALWREIRTEDTTRPVFVELEDFGVRPGFHRFFALAFAAGYRIVDHGTVGLLFDSGEISDGNQKFNAEYIFYQTRWQEYSLTGALGHYRSEYSQTTGPSAAISISRAWGQTFSLW